MWICPKCATHFKLEPYVCPHCGVDAPPPAEINVPKGVLPSVRTFLQGNEPILQAQRKRRFLRLYLADDLPASFLLPFLATLLVQVIMILFEDRPLYEPQSEWLFAHCLKALSFAFGFGVIGMFVRSGFVKSPMRHGVGPRLPIPSLPTPPPQELEETPNTRITTNTPPENDPPDESITRKSDDEGYPQ
jgi:hypothetical protein